MRRAILVAGVLTSLWSEQATAIDGNKLFEHCEFLHRTSTNPSTGR